MYKSVNVHDPISMFISIFNNGIKAQKKYMFIPYDAFVLQLIIVLYKKGYITSYKIYNYVEKDKTKSYVCVWYKRYQNKNLINLIKSYYKPSHKLYQTYEQLFNMKQRHKCELLISTSYGLKWLHECLKLKIGGVLLLELL